MSINNEYFKLNSHMEHINDLIIDYLEPFGLMDLDYNDLYSKLTDEQTRALKRIDPKAYTLGGDALGKARMKLHEEYTQWKQGQKQ